MALLKVYMLQIVINTCGADGLSPGAPVCGLCKRGRREHHPRSSSRSTSGRRCTTWRLMMRRFRCATAAWTVSYITNCLSHLHECAYPVFAGACDAHRSVAAAAMLL